MSTQNKGKKKNTKISLEEFNSFDTPHGHSVISVKKSGLDWAATMADHEIPTETEQIVVPIAPRAQLGPNIDFDALPERAPFRASLYNLPMTAEDRDVADRFFQGLNVVRVDITKATTTVEFASRQDLYDALCKDGSSFRGKTINVCLFGQQPKNSYNDRYGGRGGGSSYGDRYDRDNRGGGSSYGDRYDRDNRGDVGARDWRSRAPQMGPASFGPPSGPPSGPTGGPSGEQRPKLNLKPRQTPVNVDDAPRNEAIFGKAKPTATPYEKMKEVEEKLKTRQLY